MAGTVTDAVLTAFQRDSPPLQHVLLLVLGSNRALFAALITISPSLLRSHYSV